MFDDVICDFDSRLGGGFIPGFRNSHSALVAHAAVVGRERRGDDQGRGLARGKEVAGRNGLLHAVRRLPFEGDRRRLVFELEIIQADPIGPAAQQAKRGFVFLELAGGNPSVDQRLVLSVHPQTRAVGRFQNELVVARLVRHD